VPTPGKAWVERRVAKPKRIEPPIQSEKPMEDKTKSRSFNASYVVIQIEEDGCCDSRTAIHYARDLLLSPGEQTRDPGINSRFLELKFQMRIEYYVRSAIHKH
jgi:hypothetical protein